jgi:lysophospholipase L1-like esterase
MGLYVSSLRKRYRWRLVTQPRVLLTVVSLLCALVTVAAYRATPAAADVPPKPLSQVTVTTNNIQGSTGGTDSKWTTTVRGLVQTNEVVLLQEVGPSGPPNNQANRQPDIERNGATIQHWNWQVGVLENPSRNDSVSLAQVYFLQTDNFGGTNTGGRVNLAIVTRDVPDDFMVVTNPNQHGRDALGVRFGTTWYFTIHGLSFGGAMNDSVVLVGAVNAAVQDYNTAHPGLGSTYTIGGDFNLNPSLLTLPNDRDVRIINSGRATQQQGGELDYFVSNDPTPAPVIASRGRRAARENGAQPDHYAVRIGGMFAAAGPPSDKIMFQALKCGGNTGVLCGNETPTYVKVGAYGMLLPAILGLSALGLKRSVDFVGDDTTTDSNGVPQEGSVGEEISADAAQDATDIPKYMPNVVMLQAGTQDLLNGDASGAPGQLSALIDQIQTADPTAVVLVGTLDPMADAANEALVTTYNTSVQQLVATKRTAGRRVALADMSEVTTADLNTDGVTPNDSGQQKVADAFNSALLDAEVLGWVTEPVPASAPSGSVCDIYAYYGTACVGAYSMTRAMYSDYYGPLYQVQRGSDGALDDIGVVSPGGDVNASEQDSFCAGTTCKISVVYDQSPQLNNLTVAPGGGANPNADQPADAAALKITVGGKEAYGLDVTPGVGYRQNLTRGVATDNAAAGIHMAEGMYMVASGFNVNSGCCFDFGNAETNSRDNGEGHMDSLNLSTTCYYQSSQGPCTGTGPWVEADLENGLFQGKNGTNTANTGNNSAFVTAMLKNNGTNTYAIKGGDAQSGGLSTYWSGALPAVPGQAAYAPMQKEGAIILGTGGDNSNSDTGSFFEGVMTDGYPSDAADTAVQANITAAQYAGDSGGMPPSSSAPSAAGPAVLHDGYSSMFTVDSANGHLEESYLAQLGGPWAAHDLNTLASTPPVMPNTMPVALVHDGYTSVYTVAAADGHLDETYLPKLGGPWYYQDLSNNYQTPQVQAGTSPVAIVHAGYTSVYTVDPNHHLWETYLPKLGGPWYAQDLSAKYMTPATAVTPTAVVHAGYTSVYTVDDVTRDLQETFLPAIGGPWHTQDLSAEYQTPPVAPGTQPVAFYHTGYTSVYTVDEASQHVQETYLPYIGDGWTTQDFTTKYHTPVTSDTPAVLLHPASGGDLWCSVFTIGEFDDHLEESYLPVIGADWTFHDLSVLGGTPGVAAAGSSQASSSVAHDGYTSAFTVNKSNYDLQETFLPGIGQSWASHDLNTLAQTPKVMARTAPISVVHDGYTSVFTIDQSGDLWETYLPKLGGPWYSHDLTAMAKTPKSVASPTAVFHSGYTSVYTVDSSNGHLDETYLPALGGPWYFQDLTVNYKTPPVIGYSSPTAILHDGWVSVFTVDGVAGQANHVQETYLAAIGSGWVTQDLTQNYSVPAAALGSSPTAVFHTGFTSVYTIDTSGDIQENYLPAIGDAWVTQDLSVNYGIPRAGSGESLMALYHTGFTSLYYIQANGDLQESFLPAVGDAWGNQDLTTKSGAPVPDPVVGLTSLLHADTSGALTWTSVFTADKGSDDLRETYLSAIGGNWATNDLSVLGLAPPV